MGAERNVFIGRELSKIYEQCVSTTLADIQDMIWDGRIATKGEFVIVVAGNQTPDTATTVINISKLIAEISAVLPTTQAVDLISVLSGRRRNEIYRLLLAQRK